MLLAGRSGGQSLIGGTGAGDDLTFQTTSHGTKGSYIFSEMTSAGFVKNSAAGVVTGGNAIEDSDVPDTITASNYLPLSGGTLSGALTLSNLGVGFTASDTNPACNSGDYNIFADLSEAVLKKCEDGAVSDFAGGENEIYVATTGDDSTGDGSFLSPWQSIQKGLDEMSAGTTLYIRAGEYDNNGSTISKRLNCTEQLPCKIEAYPGEVVKINTSVDITGFTSEGSNLWISSSVALGASVNTSFWGLWKNDTIMTRVTSDPTTETQARMISLGSGNFQFRIYSTTDPTSNTFSFAGTGGTKSNTGARLYGSYVTVRNIDFTKNYFGLGVGDGTEGDGTTSNIVLDKLSFYYNAERALYVGTRVGRNTRNIHLKDNLIHDTCQSSPSSSQNQHGLKLAADSTGDITGINVLIEGNVSYNNCYHGYQISEAWDYVTVRNNVGFNNNLAGKSDGADFRMGLSLAPGYDGHIVYDNVSMFTKYGFYFGGMQHNSRLYNNKAYDNSEAGYYIRSFTGAPVGDNNLITSNYTEGAKYGFYFHVLLGSSPRVSYNRIKNPTTSGIYVSSTTTDADFDNNFIESDSASVKLVEVAAGGVFTADNNQYSSPSATPFSYGGVSYNFSDYKTNTSQEANSIFTAPVVDTNASTLCSGSTTYLDGEGNCDDISSVYQAADADLTDLSDGSLTGSKVGFADTDSNFAATNIQAAIEELDDVNGSGVNAGDGKVHWTQLVGVPAGFADGSDDGSGGGSGDVTGVGDCASGDCGDGTSDGGTYFRLYDGDSHYGQIQTANLAANRTYTLPDETGTICTTGSVCSGYQASGSYLTSESDPTVDSSAEIQAIIGASVYQAYDADLTTWAGVTPASGVATFLATPSSANLISAVTNETGTGALVFGTTPTIGTPLLTLSTTTATTAGRFFRDAAHYIRMGNGSSIEDFFPAGTVTDANLCTYDDTGKDYDCNTPTSTFQSADADLTTYAGITPSANVQSLLGAADYSAMRTLLGLVIGTNVQAYDADLTTYAGITPSANIQSLLGSADYSAARTNLGLAIGTNVQAYDADLDDLADGSLTGSKVGFADTDSNFAATNIQAAIEELDDANGSGPNAADYKVNWTQIGNMPAGFADGTDDGAGGGGGSTALNLPIYSAKITGSFVEDGDATQGAQIDAGDGNWRLLFDASTDEGAVWQFVMPDNYTGSPALKIKYSMTSANANEVEFEGAIMCVTPGDSADVGTPSFSTIAVASDTVPGTAGYLDGVTITLNDDSCAAGDQVWIGLSTDADDATNDDATGDREVIGVEFDYA